MLKILKMLINAGCCVWHLQKAESRQFVQILNPVVFVAHEVLDAP